MSKEGMEFKAKVFDELDKLIGEHQSQLRNLVDRAMEGGFTLGFDEGRARGFQEGEEHARETVSDWYQPEPMVNR